MMKCSTSLAIKEIQTKTSLRFYLLLEWLLSRTKTTTNVGKEMGRKEPSYTVGGNVNYYNHYETHYGALQKN
jgi:hypothetical protein